MNSSDKVAVGIVDIIYGIARGIGYLDKVIRLIVAVLLYSTGGIGVSFEPATRVVGILPLSVAVINSGGQTVELIIIVFCLLSVRVGLSNKVVVEVVLIA